MPDAVAQLRSLVGDADPYARDDREIAPLLLRALDERLRQHREQIRVVDMRARELGTERIEQLEDVVPLLFAHTTYKSYPESFLENGRWDRLALWLDTLSSRRIRDLDVAGVEDVDGFLARCHESGHHVFATSGTSGKNSFLNQTEEDLRLTRAHVHNVRWATGIEPRADRPFFVLLPHRSPTRFGTFVAAMVEAYARPDATFHLFDEPVRMSELNEMARLRRRMADGTAAASEIEAAREAAARRQSAVQHRLAEVTGQLLTHRHEPMIVQGLWSQLYSIVETARERGIGDGEFHPDTVVMTGGGLKGTVLPDDYREQVARFFNVRSVVEQYGMQELTLGFPRCGEGRYHRPPWVAMMILDRDGVDLLNPAEGRVDGRMACFDVTVEGRWGGVITGDHVKADFSPCPCGRPGPTVLEITRYTDLTDGDDKLTCSGTVESYVRGVISD